MSLGQCTLVVRFYITEDKCSTNHQVNLALDADSAKVSKLADVNVSASILACTSSTNGNSRCRKCLPSNKEAVQDGTAYAPDLGSWHVHKVPNEAPLS